MTDTRKTVKLNDEGQAICEQIMSRYRLGNNYNGAVMAALRDWVKNSLEIAIVGSGGYPKTGTVLLKDMAGSGEAFPTGRDTSRSEDIGYTEYKEKCRHAYFGQTAHIVYLFNDQEMQVESEEDLPWDWEHIKHIEID